jgi:hypothetical protein
VSRHWEGVRQSGSEMVKDLARLMALTNLTELVRHWEQSALQHAACHPSQITLPMPFESFTKVNKQLKLARLLVRMNDWNES